jgi:hypothetical protein
MNWEAVLIDIILIIIILAIIAFVLSRRKVTVYMISAIKSDALTNIEMRVSTDKNEIDAWERTFWNRGYQVSRKTEVVKLRRFKGKWV